MSDKTPPPELTYEEIAAWILDGLKSATLTPKVMRDEAGNITYIYTVPTNPMRGDSQRKEKGA